MNKEYNNTPISLFEIDIGYMPNHDLHNHEFHEFFITLDGKGEQLVETGCLKMKKGDFFFFPSYHPHHANKNPDLRCFAGVIFLHEKIFFQDTCKDIRDLFHAMKKEANAGKYKYQLNSIGFKNIKNIFTSMLIENREKKTGYQSILISLMNQLLVNLGRYSNLKFPEKNNKIPPKNIGRILDIINFMKTNFMTPLTVEQVAKMSDMSRSYFHTYFKEATGQTFIDFLNDIRIKEAIKQFKNTTLSTKEIAENCGFSSQSQFYKVLKESTGKTPKQLRFSN